MASSSRFFDRFPRFRETSVTDVRGERLDYRYRALIERNVDFIRGRRVLDLASHDGRWSMAALDAGAKHATGIEARSELVAHARSTFETYGVAGDRFDFIEGDCLAGLESLGAGEFDTVFCFGFLYHTLHQYDLLRGVTRLEPKALLIDSRIVPGNEAALHLAYNDSTLEGAAVASVPGEESVLVAVPSRRALLVMLEHLGWQTEVQETLAPATPGGEGIRDYCEGRRTGIVARRAPG